MTPTELLDRRIAELETRLDELRALRRLLEPATVAVFPQPATDPLPEPERKPDPNVARPAVKETPAVNGRVPHLPAKEEPKPKPAKKPGRPFGQKTGPHFLTMLQKERCQVIARLIDQRGSIGTTELQSLTAETMGKTTLSTLLSLFGSPPQPQVSAWFKKLDGIHSPWTLTELGKKELLTTAPSTPSATAGAYDSVATA